MHSYLHTSLPPSPLSLPPSLPPPFPSLPPSLPCVSSSLFYEKASSFYFITVLKSVGPCYLVVQLSLGHNGVHALLSTISLDDVCRLTCIKPCTFFFLRLLAAVKIYENVYSREISTANALFGKLWNCTVYRHGHSICYSHPEAIPTSLLLALSPGHATSSFYM